MKLVQRLAALDWSVPAQDVRISLRRIPARIGSGFVITPVNGAEVDPVPATETVEATGGASRSPLQ